MEVYRSEDPLGSSKQVYNDLQNKANHVFGNKNIGKHNLSNFLDKFSGNKEKAFNIIQNVTVVL